MPLSLILIIQTDTVYLVDVVFPKAKAVNYERARDDGLLFFRP